MTKTTRRPSTRSFRTWRRLSAHYGTRLVDQYGKSPPEDWCRTIDGTDDPRLEQALMVLRREYPDHPPTLGQFERCIPEREIDNENVIDALAVYVTTHSRFCEHQRCMPWTYFGYYRETVDARGRPSRIPITTGVTVPVCDCPQGNHGIRVRYRDIR